MFIKVTKSIRSGIRPYRTVSFACWKSILLRVPITFSTRPVKGLHCLQQALCAPLCFDPETRKYHPVLQNTNNETRGPVGIQVEIDFKSYSVDDNFGTAVHSNIHKKIKCFD